MVLLYTNHHNMRKSITFYVKSALVILLILVSNLQIFAVKARKGLVTVKQPDGTELTIKLNGDEFYRYRTTEDNYVVTKNSAGYYVYAAVDNQGKITPTAQIAKNPNQRSIIDSKFLKKMPQRNFSLSSKMFRVKAAQSSRPKPRRVTPYFGAKKGLVILAAFKDKLFTVPSTNTAFTNLLNQSGYSANGGTGSAKDYFMASSYGKFTPQFDVVGPVTLPQNMDFYGANDENGYDVNPMQMVVDACKLANEGGVDFSQYDTDGDGYVDNVFVYYSGYNEAEDIDGTIANTIWPHAYGIYPADVYQDGDYLGTEADVTFDGKIVCNYACTSELNGNSGSNMCGVGTFCHEFGHVLGLPDYYHTNDATFSKATLDEWSIMDYGSYNNNGRTPPLYSAYDRFYLGYSTPTECKTPSLLTLNPLSQEKTTPTSFDNQSVLLSATSHNLNGSNPSPKEFFVLEYRKKTGWDSFIPDEGLLIWHIDYDADEWYNNAPNNYTDDTQTEASHMRVYLQPLVGSSTTPGDAFTSGNFTPKLWNGTTINRDVSDITKTNDNITFKLMANAATAKITVGVIENNLTYTSTKLGSSKTKNINIKANGITSNLSLVITGDDANSFAVTASSITQSSANATGGFDLNISFTPQRTGAHSAVLTISGGGMVANRVINLSGSAVD